MVPGNIIEWVYKQTDELIAEDEMLWSSLMKRYVPIGSCHVHALISIDSERIVWMNEEGLFYARVDDTLAVVGHAWPTTVVPREKIGRCNLVT